MVFENRTAFTILLSAVSRIEVIPSVSAQLARLKEPTFEPEGSVIFRTAGRGGDSGDDQAKAQIDILERWNNGYRIPHRFPLLVVVSQMYYPGWKASVDGLPTLVYPVDAAHGLHSPVPEFTKSGCTSGRTVPDRPRDIDLVLASLVAVIIAASIEPLPRKMCRQHFPSGQEGVCAIKKRSRLLMAQRGSRSSTEQ